MTVYLKIKALSKRRPIISSLPFTIDKHISTSNALVEYIIRRNVDEYNKLSVDKPIFRYLTEDELNHGAQAGKIGFGDRKNEKPQEVSKAVENAITCFKDGIFRLFINDIEAAFGEDIGINEGDEITFIRLTMLAGRKW